MRKWPSITQRAKEGQRNAPTTSLGQANCGASATDSLGWQREYRALNTGKPTRGGCPIEHAAGQEQLPLWDRPVVAVSERPKRGKHPAVDVERKHRAKTVT